MGVIQDILAQFGQDTVSLIQSNLSSTNTNATGQTSNSLAYELDGETRLKVTGKPYIMVVETGRREGKRPPISPIIEWLQSGKVSFEGDIRSAAFAISASIGKSGTKLYQQGGREDIITPATSDQRINELSSLIADVEMNKIVNVIERSIDGR